MSPPTELSDGQAKAAAPVVKADPPARQRRWTAKVKTGCTTCRTRRIKCDEKLPICNNCALRQRACDIAQKHPVTVGPLATARSARRLTPRFQNGISPSEYDYFVTVQNVCGSGATSAAPGLSRDIKPSEWDWVEACEYLNLYLPAATERDLLLPSDFVRKPGRQTFTRGPTFETFILGALTSSMLHLGRGLGVYIDDEHDTAMVTLRKRCNHYMACALQRINDGISKMEVAQKTRVYSVLIGLIDSEMRGPAPTLRLHLQGFITLIKTTGGIQRALERKEVNILAVIYAIVLTTAINTTSPPTDMISAEFSLTNDDIFTCYASTLYSSFTCPTHLFLCVRDINQLRRDMAHGKQSFGKIQATALSILERVEAFQPSSWFERYEMPRMAFRMILARMYKCAVALFARLTLAKRARIEYDDARRLEDARYLAKLILSTADIVPIQPTCWPLIVAGVGLAGASFADKSKVMDRIYEVAWLAHGSDGPFKVLDRLRIFWASGKTEWDECFNSWYFPLAE